MLLMGFTWKDSFEQMKDRVLGTSQERFLVRKEAGVIGKTSV